MLPASFGPMKNIPFPEKAKKIIYGLFRANHNSNKAE
jgi:hypothetical protein